jgi:hypothetical protein
VPDDLVIQTNLLGTDDMVRARIAAYRDAGVTTLRLAPAGKTVADRIDTLARAVELVVDMGSVR